MGLSTADKSPKTARSGRKTPPIKHALGTASPYSRNGWHKRVQKACERCRRKKTKCDGEVPCKRCQDDGQICTSRMQNELECEQSILIATVYKLYFMLRKGAKWGLEEPKMNEHGQPIVHDIAQKLGCIRFSSNGALRVNSTFPEDRLTGHKLARQVEEQQLRDDRNRHGDTDASILECDSNLGAATNLELSDLDKAYRKIVFGGSAPVLSLARSCPSPKPSLPQPSLGANFFPPYSPSTPDLERDLTNNNGSSNVKDSNTNLRNNQASNFIPQIYSNTGFDSQMPLMFDGCTQGWALPKDPSGMFSGDVIELSSDVRMGLSNLVVWAGFDDVLTQYTDP